MLPTHPRRRPFTPFSILVLLLSTVAPAPAQEGPPPTSPLVRLTSRVLNAAGEPRPGIRITVTAAPDDSDGRARRRAVVSALSGQARPAATVLSEATTDEKGRFSLELPRHVEARLRLEFPDGRREFAPPMDTDRLIATWKDPLTQPERPTEEWTGRLTDLDGLTASGLHLRAVSRPGHGEGYSEIEFRSDDEGRFRVALPKGWKSTIEVLDRMTQVWPIVIDPTSRKDDERDLGELRLQSRESLAGRLVDARGRALPGRVVACLQEHVDQQVSATTDAEGRFVLTGLDPRLWHMVFLREPDLYLVNATQMASRSGRSIPGGIKARSQADGSKPGELVLHADSTITVEGRVRDAVTRKPVAGARVEAVEPHPSGFPRPTSTDAAGRYVLEHVTPGRLDIAVWHEDYRENVIGPPAPDESGDEAMTAPAAAPTRLLMPTCDLTPALEIEGLVLDPGGKPVVDALVRHGELDAMLGPLLFWVFPDRRARTDATGRFLIKGVSPKNATVELLVSPPGGRETKHPVPIGDAKRSPDHPRRIVGIVIRG
ncbi:MAG: carboxypeptidase-like regulatory domain-containing protein [Planctomycetota bacterium]